MPDSSWLPYKIGGNKFSLKNLLKIIKCTASLGWRSPYPSGLSKMILLSNSQDGITFVRPSAVVVDSNDNIYIKDDLCVQIFNSEGRHLKTVGMKIFKYPYGKSINQIHFKWPVYHVIIGVEKFIFILPLK